MEIRYDYTNGGQLSKVSAVDQSGSEFSTYGPELYVVEYKYDDLGRVVSKTLTDNAADADTQRFEVDYEFDGRGQMTRERIMRYDREARQMKVTQDKITAYDLGRNPTSIKFHDNSGWAYSETRTYAKGYQLTGFSTSNAATVIVSTSGSYTYDTNNNMTGTKKLNVTRSGVQLAFRENWTFTFDRKNRMKSHTHSGASNVRGNLWYSGAGQVFQRWNDNSSTGIWADSLYRYIYDGALAQEHSIDADEVASAWVYTYNRINTDYLRKPDGPREKVTSDGTNFTDRFLLQDGANISARIIRQTDNKVERMELTSSGDRQSGGSEQDTQVSKLGIGGGFIEGYASASGATAYFDPLVQSSGRHYLSGVGRRLSRMGNNAYTDLGGISWDEFTSKIRDSQGCELLSGGPKLPGYVECCWEPNPDTKCNQIMRRRYDTGWFPFCCCTPCNEFLARIQGTHPTCDPGCQCWPDIIAPCGGGCSIDHCDWSFGFKGDCGANNLKFENCGTAFEEAIKSSFKVACEAARNCACRTFIDDQWQRKMSDDHRWYDWTAVWGCVARYCRNGGITFVCDSDECKNDTSLIGRNLNGGRILLCSERHKGEAGYSVANTILHEMLHVCGDDFFGLWGYGQEVYPEDVGRNYDKVSAASFIADKCIRKEKKSETELAGDILVSPPRWWEPMGLLG